MNKLLVLLLSSVWLMLTNTLFAQTQGAALTFELKNDTYDFGSVTDGEVVVYDYKFTNTGNQPLIIYKAEVACNCTVAEWPKRPVMPGQTGSIKVTYKSEGNVGKVNKQVYIKSNATLPSKYKNAYEINLIGHVKPKK
jgi:hypothetical protein